MKDLLKEAIADAKAVRETALANAKLALEEAFTPRLQSMISAKLSEEMDEEEPMEEEEEMHASEEETPMPEPAPEAEGDDDMMDDDDSEEMNEMDEDDLDLDEIIRELEMAEELDSSDIGTGDNKFDELEADTDNDDDLFAEGEDEMMDEEEDEEIDIQEVIRALREEDEEMEEEPMEEAEHGEELEEAYNVIRFLKGKINEVNLLNAKLLYSNKLFRNFSLNESQKMKVIENFDRAFNLREVKLVYSTLAESFKSPAVTRKIVKESFASKPVASTKPAKQVISEGADLANRFQKLAGLIK